MALNVQMYHQQQAGMDILFGLYVCMERTAGERRIPGAATWWFLGFTTTEYRIPSIGLSVEDTGLGPRTRSLVDQKPQYLLRPFKARGVSAWGVSPASTCGSAFLHF